MNPLPATLATTLAVFAPASAMAADATPEARLHDAAGSGDARAIGELLRAGARLDTRDEAQRTPLLVATRLNHVDAARVLIEAGADVNAKDAIHDSAYLHAGARGHLEILRMTLAHGADLASTNRYGGTALIPAAERGHVETVRTLIDAGVDVDHVNRLGWTALLEAIILGDGVTPRQHAHRRGHAAIERLLADAGAQ